MPLVKRGVIVNVACRGSCEAGGAETEWYVRWLIIGNVLLTSGTGNHSAIFPAGTTVGETLR